jgi:hypothetical protein
VVIRLGAKLRRATAEDLRLGKQLGVYFEADHGLKFTGWHSRSSRQRRFPPKKIVLSLEGPPDSQQQSFFKGSSKDLQPDR